MKELLNQLTIAMVSVGCDSATIKYVVNRIQEYLDKQDEWEFKG